MSARSAKKSKEIRILLAFSSLGFWINNNEKNAKIGSTRTSGRMKYVLPEIFSGQFGCNNPIAFSNFAKLKNCIAFVEVYAGPSVTKGLSRTTTIAISQYACNITTSPAGIIMLHKISLNNACLFFIAPPFNSRRKNNCIPIYHPISTIYGADARSGITLHPIFTFVSHDEKGKCFHTYNWYCVGVI